MALVMASDAGSPLKASNSSSGDEPKLLQHNQRNFTNLFTDEHDAFIISLKIRQRQSWTDIARLFNVKFPPVAPHPPRTAGGLQVRYSRNIRPKLMNAGYREMLTDVMTRVDPEFGTVDETYVDMPTPPTITKSLRTSRKRKANRDHDTDSDLSEGEPSPTVSRKLRLTQATTISSTSGREQNSSPRKFQRLSTISKNNSGRAIAPPSLLVALKLSPNNSRLARESMNSPTSAFNDQRHFDTPMDDTSSEDDGDESRSLAPEMLSANAESRTEGSQAPPSRENAATVAESRTEGPKATPSRESAAFIATRERTNAVRSEQVDVDAPRWVIATKEQIDYLLNSDEVPRLYRSAALLKNRIIQYAPRTGSWGTRARTSREKNLSYQHLADLDLPDSVKKVVAASCKMDWDSSAKTTTAIHEST